MRVQQRLAARIRYVMTWGGVPTAVVPCVRAFCVPFVRPGARHAGWHGNTRAGVEAGVSGV